MFQREALRGDGFRLVTPTAEIMFQRLAPRVALVTGYGELIEEMSADVFAGLNAMLGPRKVYYFSDMERVTGYDLRIRSLWAEWFVRHRNDVELFALVRSSMAKMGLTLMSIAGGGFVHAFLERQAFEARLLQILAESPD